MSQGDERMQELCLEELSGSVQAPDVRQAVRARIRRRTAMAMAAVAATVLVATTLGWWLTGGRPAPDAELLALVERIAVPLAVATGPGQLAAIRDDHWRAHVAALDRLDAHPQFWAELEPAIAKRLATDLPGDVRSRFVTILASAPGDAVEFVLLHEIRTHAADLDAGPLLLLEARELDGASAALRALAPRDRRSEILRALWQIRNGDLRPMGMLTALVGSEAELVAHADLYFAAAITLYRARRLQIWGTCWRVADRHIRSLLAAGETARAYQLTLEMAWYYPFLSIVETLPLADARWRAHRYVKNYASDKSQREEIADWLARMK